MNQDNFNAELDKLTYLQKIMLRRFLAGETPKEIASAMGYESSNIRKHLNKVCTRFGFINEQGEHFSFQQALVKLFVQYKPEWVNFDFWDGYRLYQTEPDFPGRPVSPQSPFYIKRFYSNSSLVETLCSQNVLQPGTLIRIKAPKKMGKTSLLNHILAEAKNYGYRIIRLNVRQAEESIFDNLDHFLQWFCTNISQKLNLESRLDDYWDNNRLGSMASCTTYFQAYLLQQIDTPLVLGLDEVDRLFEYEKIAQAFFPLLRSWHEDANNLEVWQKLRLVVAYSTEVYIPLNLNQSPFNVGVPVKLPELTLEQVQQLAREYGLNWLAGSDVEQLWEMVGGHPYLIQLALYHLRQDDITLEKLLQTASTPVGIYSSYLQSLWIMLREHSELLEALRTLLENNVVHLEAILAYKLESMGIVQFEGISVKFRCLLYRRFFSSYLIIA